MILILAFECIVGAVIILGTITQIMVPIYRGTKLFPMFRKTGELEGKIAEANTSLDEARLEKEEEKVKEKAAKEKEKEA